MRLIPAPYRILALVLLALACIGFGYVQGLSREADRRDAQELKRQQDDDALFLEAVNLGHQAAANSIEWKRRAQIYYRNWQERLSNEKDANLAQCEPAQAGVPVVVLSGTWVGLYNAAWQPEQGAEGDTGGAAAEVAAAGSATPREALDNVAVNAQLCGEDRRRLDGLIDLLNEIGAAQ